jgi:glycosyltransferase involved in cell wall biosynthesis
MSIFLSVVIPLFNKEKFIEQTLRSVLNQTFQDFEVIIVNDGSTDNSREIVKNFLDTRIIIVDQENLGLSAARNTGIEKAKFDFIAFLDADDLWKEDYLETMANMIHLNNSFKVFASKVDLLTPRKKADLSPVSFNENRMQLIDCYFDHSKNIFSPSSLIINANVFEKIGGFNGEVNYGEDEDFFIRCFSSYSLVYYNEQKVYYRKGYENQLTSPNSGFKRIIPDYLSYLNKSNEKILKPYLDFIHFKLVVLFKMERNHRLVKFYKEKINASNLTLIQKFKYHLPTSIFYFTKTAYIWLSRRFTHF